MTLLEHTVSRPKCAGVKLKSNSDELDGQNEIRNIFKCIDNIWGKNVLEMFHLKSELNW